MDTIFFLKADARAAFLRSLAGALDCSYICLWSYSSHNPQFLIWEDGLYNENDMNSFPGSSSVIGDLFSSYSASIFVIDSGRIPGLVTKFGSLYLELKDSQILSFAAVQAQNEFYQGAGIKTIAFMRCKSGEIEIGASTSSNNGWQLKIMNFCAEYFLQRPSTETWRQNEGSRPSSSSSSFVSKSTSSPECSSLLCNIDNIADISAQYNNLTRPSTVHLNSINQFSPQFPQMGTFEKNRLPSSSQDDEAMARAMLAVISSAQPSTSSNSSVQTQISYSKPFRPKMRYRSRGCFKPYNLIPRQVLDTKNYTSSQSHTSFKRVMAFLRKMAGEEAQQSLPMSNQMQHIISERKRREKLNEFFGLLRASLPPGTKKDKASVLSTTIAKMGNLRKQVLELKEKNNLLQRQLFEDQTCDQQVSNFSDKFEISISKMSESTSETQQIGVQIAVKNEVSDLTYLVISLLECLKAKNMGSNLITLDANIRNKLNNVQFGLQVKTNEWVEENFKDFISGATYEHVEGKGLAA